MYVYGESYLVTLCGELDLLLGSHLKNGESAPALLKDMHRQWAMLGSRGYKVSCVHYDSARNLAACTVFIEKSAAIVNPHGPGQHVPQIERRIQVVKQRARCIVHSLPYTLPLRLAPSHVEHAIGATNVLATSKFPGYTSPLETFLERKLDFKIDFRGSFGDYVQVHEPNITFRNDMTARTNGAILLNPLHNNTGSYRVFMLGTGTIVTRDRWTPLPTPQEVIDHLSKLAAHDKMKVNLDPIWKLGNVVIGDLAAESPLGSDPAPGAPIPLVLPTDFDGNPVHMVVPAIEGGKVVSSGDIRGDIGGVNSLPVLLSSDDIHTTVPRMFNGVDDTEPINASPHSQRSSRSNTNLGESHSVNRGVAVPKRGNREIRNLASAATNGFNLATISEKKAFEKYQEIAATASTDELKQIVDDFGAFEPVVISEQSREAIKGAIPSQMVYNEKFKAHGPFDKLKARFVGGGHRQDRTKYEKSDITSHCVSVIHLFSFFAIAAYEHRKVFTLDVKGAYLNAAMKVEVLMWINPRLTSLIVKLHPEWKRFVSKEGKMLVRLLKALYGCIEAGNLWFHMLQDVILALEVEYEGITTRFVENPSGECVYNVYRNDIQCSLCVYVDDMTGSSECDILFELVITHLESHFPGTTTHRGTIHNFLGMVFEIGNGEAIVSMPKMIEDLLSEHAPKKVSRTPAAVDLFKVDPTSPLLSPTESKALHSAIMKTKYVVERARPDFAVAISFLTTRVRALTEQDANKFNHAMQYLLGTKELALRLRIDPSVGPLVVCWVDIAHAVHEDLKDQVGHIITLGGGAVQAKSKKSKIVTRSSTEGEIHGVSEVLSPVLGLRYFMLGQGYDMPAAIIKEDNLPTIHMIERGRPGNDATRHISIRVFQAHHFHKAGELNMEWTDTIDQKADSLSKPTQGSLFESHRDRGILA